MIPGLHIQAAKLLRYEAILVFVFLFMAIKVSHGQNSEFSYTYQNISRLHGGGTLEQGDTIEIRALMKVNNPASNVFYRDTIAAGLQYIPNSIKIITNEGLLFRGPFTDAGGDDVAMVKMAGTRQTLRVNIGAGASIINNSTDFSSTSGGGNINPGDKPKFYGTTLFVVAYRLRVTANYGDTIFPTGHFFYRTGGGSTYRKESFFYGGIKIIRNSGLCQNSTGSSFTAESDFGFGNNQNRAAGADVPGYGKKNLSANAPNDNYYAIANNTSADGTTDNTGPYKPANNPHRVFGGFWDIIGDHTGAADPQLGNPPVPPGTNGGYMLVVNAAYPTGEAYRDIIMDVCPNTYYEFSAWLRNICGYCGIDSNSVATYKPGVLPNLAFTINDIDYYTTGELPWNEKWEKRGFIYKTGPTETSFKITIKNNAAGGGGNDWVLDDIMLATCYPEQIMSPDDEVEVCVGGVVDLKNTVISYFDNYTHYQWERSKDGVNWTSVGMGGEATPELVNGMWEYTVSYAFFSAKADSGYSYRVKVATTADNLINGNCIVQNTGSVLVRVGDFNCNIVGDVLRAFNASEERNHVSVKWAVTDEKSILRYELEKSEDGIHFRTISYINTRNSGGIYQYIDRVLSSGKIYYRLKIHMAGGGKITYSHVASVNLQSSAPRLISINPFLNKIDLEINSTRKLIASFSLYDTYGRMVNRQIASIVRGNNRLVIDGVGHLQPGVYILKANLGGTIVQQKLIKK